MHDDTALYSQEHRQPGPIFEISTKMHFRKLDQTFQLSTKILLIFLFFFKKIKKLGSVRAKFVYEIDRTLCGEHSQVNL